MANGVPSSVAMVIAARRDKLAVEEKFWVTARTLPAPKIKIGKDKGIKSIANKRPREAVARVTAPSKVPKALRAGVPSNRLKKRIFPSKKDKSVSVAKKGDKSVKGSPVRHQ